MLLIHFFYNIHAKSITRGYSKWQFSALRNLCMNPKGIRRSFGAENSFGHYRPKWLLCATRQHTTTGGRRSNIWSMWTNIYTWLPRTTNEFLHGFVDPSATSAELSLHQAVWQKGIPLSISLSRCSWKVQAAKQQSHIWRYGWVNFSTTGFGWLPQSLDLNWFN